MPKHLRYYQKSPKDVSHSHMHLLTRVLFVLFCFVFNYTYLFSAKDMTFRLVIMTFHVVFTVRMLMFIAGCFVLMLPKPKPLWFHCDAGFCARGESGYISSFPNIDTWNFNPYLCTPNIHLILKILFMFKKFFLMFDFSLQLALWS